MSAELLVVSNWRKKPQPTNPYTPCRVCGTRGFVLMRQAGYMDTRARCSNCGGRGWVQHTEGETGNA